MLDLALGIEGAAAKNYFLVAPDNRENVRAQFSQPAFSRVSELDLRYLPCSEVEYRRENIARFGSGPKGLPAIARPMTTRFGTTKTA